jgi:hypothetical protein
MCEVCITHAAAEKTFRVGSVNNPDTARRKSPVDLVRQVEQFWLSQMLDDVKRCNSLIRIIRCRFKKRKGVRLSDVRETKLPRLLNLLRRAINTENVPITRLSQEVEKRSATAAKVKNPGVSIGWKVPAD